MYDLIIAGAGPAGSAAARTAAKLGLKTLILEKEVFPRYKPCGGAVSEKVVSILDFALPEDLCERSITGARVHFRDLVGEGRKGYRLATLVSRSRFDQCLLQKAEEAGAGRATQKVLDYREEDDHVQVRTRTDAYRSRFLVIASGYQDPLKERIAGRETQRSVRHLPGDGDRGGRLQDRSAAARHHRCPFRSGPDGLRLDLSPSGLLLRRYRRPG